MKHSLGGPTAEDWQDGGFGLYLHWPFCQSKCPYCDFNSHVSKTINQEHWLEAYLSELDRMAELTRGRVLQSVFFGGGTPSLMKANVVGSILDRVAMHWTPSNDMEITLEANPGSVDAERFSGYRSAGVNRVSLGIQALNDIDLQRLGRLHSADEAMRAFGIARQTFDRVSFDLIYARQDQTLGQWETELTQALRLGVDHLSLYQLTIEDGTAFGDRFARGMLRGLPDENVAADMFEMTQRLCADAGLNAYEVSNHARPGSESRHNMIYWRAGDYLGIGPGAHGRLTLNGTRWATECHSVPDRWLSAVKGGNGISEQSALSRKEQGLEYLLMGLRLSDGIDINKYARLSGEALSSDKIGDLTALGLVLRDRTELRTTAKGRLLLNRIIEELAPE